MNTKVLNYRVIIEKEKGKKKGVYIAHAPSLGISDFGTTVDDALLHITGAIKIYLETLIDLKRPIPEADSDEYFVTTSKVKIGIVAN